MFLYLTRCRYNLYLISELGMNFKNGEKKKQQHETFMKKYISFLSICTRRKKKTNSRA